MTPIRFPIAPVAAAMAIELGRPGGNRPGDPPRGLAAIAERCGVSLSTAKRWQRNGIPEPDADRVACDVLNTHPALIWDGWWDEMERLVKRESGSTPAPEPPGPRGPILRSEVSPLVKRVRDFLGATQDDMGAWFGVAGSTVCGWERGYSVPAPEVLAELRSMLDEIVAERNDLAEVA